MEKPEHQPIPPGTMIDGHHRIDAVIGTGGFATVYRGTDVVTERPVAIKVLHPDLQRNQRAMARFERELRAAALLRHPNMVTLFAHGTTEDGLRFIVFEYVGGEDLAELLRREGALAPEVAQHILEQILGALEEAHSMGLLHRDLKPENIRIYEQPRDRYAVKVLDLGIARFTGEHHENLTDEGELVGTPRYMSPEQLLGGELTPASDIYSLGMLTFEMLTGRESLQGNAWSDQLERLRSGHFFETSGFANLRLAEVVNRMTERKPELRYQSVTQVLEALAREAEPPDEPETTERRLVEDDTLRDPTAEHATTQEHPKDEPRTTATTHADARRREPDRRRRDGKSGPRKDSHRSGNPQRKRRPKPPPPDPPPAASPAESPWATIGTVALGLVLGLGIMIALFSVLDGADAPAPIEPPPISMASAQRLAPQQPVFDEPDLGAAPEPAPVRPKTKVRETGCGGESPWVGGREFDVDGVTWTSYLPPGVDNVKPIPVIILFHSLRPSKDELRFRADIVAAAGDAKMAVVTLPHRRSFQYTRDTTEISVALEKTAGAACVDLDRVFAVGDEKSGDMSRLLACAANLAGIASTLPDEYGAGCQPKPAVPHILFSELDASAAPTNSIVRRPAGTLSEAKARRRWVVQERMEAAWIQWNQCYPLAGPWHVDDTCHEFSCTGASLVACRESRASNSAASIVAFFAAQRARGE